MIPKLQVEIFLKQLNNPNIFWRILYTIAVPDWAFETKLRAVNDLMGYEPPAPF